MRRGDFAWALEELRGGERVQRAGWNGKGMFVCLQPGYPNGIAINANTADAIGEPQGTVHRFEPYFMFKTAQGSFVPWLASVTDLLASDWQRYAKLSEPVQPAEASTDSGDELEEDEGDVFNADGSESEAKELNFDPEAKS